jgi:protein involved in polysaccharide export with SLBB domain
MKLLLTTLCLSASLLAAQQPDGPPLATRDRLGAELARLAQERGSDARARAVQIRQRLENGDFQIGDRILIRVDGEPQLSDTFTVQDGPALALPQLGSLPLRGVLRSELQGRLETHLAHYLRNPVVQVQPLVRLLVEGDVVRPGYYSLAPRQALTDALAQAGGLNSRAKTSGIRIDRGNEQILSGPQLQDALGRGYSLDQLNLRAGDRLLVPAGRDSERTWRILGIAVSLPLALYSATRIFH